MARPTILKIDLGERQEEAERFKDAHPDVLLSDLVRTSSAQFLFLPCLAQVIQRVLPYATWNIQHKIEFTPIALEQEASQ